MNFKTNKKMSEIVAGNKLDINATGKVKVKKTKFPLSRHHFNTYRFGEYGIIMAENGIADDKWIFRIGTSIQSYTLKAPLMTPIHMNKDFFMVPKMAILPNAWEKIFTNPTIGDDIDASEYGTSVKASYFNNYAKNINLRLYYQWNTDQTTWTTINDLHKWFETEIYALNLAEKLWSGGSLINCMGAKLHRTWRDANTHYNFDTAFEDFWKNSPIGLFRFTDRDTNEDFYVTTPSFTGTESAKRAAASNYKVLSFNEFWNKIKDGMRLEIISTYNLNASTQNSTLAQAQAVFTAWKSRLPYDAGYNSYTVTAKPFDIAKLWAYHLMTAEFYTNDKVDYIYTAELYREYISSLIHTSFSTLTKYYFTINGIKIPIDWLSAWWFKEFENIFVIQDNIVASHYAYFNTLFKYERSLKYKDYFTGSRTRPLAIGDTKVTVNSNLVDVVDISAKIQLQRFLNIANKVPRTLKGYTKGIFGKDVAPDWHNPLWLASTREKIFGNETENTGADQYSREVSRTTTLNNGGKNIEFNVELDRNSVIIGVVSFDIERAYSLGIQRDFTHVDRFDMYNPYMQYTGDQAVFTQEFDCADKTGGTFGYQGAYMEFKQRVNEASGGFITALPGWTFMDSYVDANNAYERPIYTNIGPDFIRSKSTELDKFYIGLSGVSMANYFHFIADNDIICDCIRPMSFNPQILG